MGELYSQHGALARHCRESRPRVVHSKSIHAVFREHGQAAPDVLLVGGMDIVGITDVDREGLARVGQREGLRLRFAQRCVGETRGIGGIFVVGETHPIERKVALAEVRPPRGNHRREEPAVFCGPLGVALTLIPHRAADRIGQQRIDHAVEQASGSPRIAGTTGGAGAGIFF